MAAFDLHPLEGLARDLSGTGQYFSRASSAALNPGAALLTICVWVRADAVAGPVTIASKYGAAGNRGWKLSLDTAAGAIYPVFSVSGDGTALVTVNPGVDLMDTGAWAMVVAAYSATAGKVYAQINDGTVYEQAGAPASIFDSTADFCVGALAGGATLFDGQIAKLGMWIGVIPTAGQLTQLYNGGLGLTRYALPESLLTSLVAWYDGDEISGSLLDGFASYDLAATGAPGTAAGPDLASATGTVAHPTKPEPTVGRSLLSSVASARTIGGRIRSQERGPDQIMYTTAWPVTTDAHVVLMETWFARYSGNREPYYLELPDGSRLRCRCPQGSLPSPYSPAGWRSIGPVEHVEDIL